MDGTADMFHRGFVTGLNREGSVALHKIRDLHAGHGVSLRWSLLDLLYMPEARISIRTNSFGTYDRPGYFPCCWQAPGREALSYLRTGCEQAITAPSRVSDMSTGNVLEMWLCGSRVLSSLDAFF